MTMKRRKFTKEEKNSMLKEAGTNGATVTLAKHSIYPATFYAWKKKVESMGEVGLDHGITKKRLRKISVLELLTQQSKTYLV